MADDDYDVIEIGEDSDRWLVVSQVDVHRETISIAASRLAVIRTLREQLLPDDEYAFASCVEEVLDASCTRYQYPILADEQMVFYESPIGAGAPGGFDRLGTCGVAIGFSLPDHHAALAESSGEAVRRG